MNKKGSLKIIVAVVILIILIAIVGLGVYYYNAYHNLTFQLNNVGLGSVSLSVLTLNFAIGINNTNLLPVYIPSGSFEVYVNNQHLGGGTFGSATIGGNSQGQIIAPVTFNVTDLPSVLVGLITGGGSVTVTIQGSANLWLFSIPFNSTLYNTKIV